MSAQDGKQDKRSFALPIDDEQGTGIDRAIRILHVVGEMNRGGIETWLMHVLRKMDRSRFAMDFVVATSKESDHDEEILNLGSQVIDCGSRKSVGFGRRLQQAMHQHGPYDVVHAHVNHHNGYVVRIAQRAKVPIRISHSHTDTTAKERAASFKRRLYVHLMHHWIAKHSTLGLAASRPAAVSMFGPQWNQQDLCRVMHCGLDLAPFRKAYDPVTTRNDLRIPQDAWVIGHVGRMVDVKNHPLIINTFAQVLSETGDAYLLLVGEGPLRDKIEQQACELGVINRVRFAGARDDVPQLLCAVVNAFIFPSKFEGLGMVLIEAQAAGLPCLVSEVVPDEADVIPELITRLSLTEPWSSHLLATREITRKQKDCLDRIQKTDFCIEKGVSQLQSIYTGIYDGSGAEACQAEEEA